MDYDDIELPTESSKQILKEIIENNLKSKNYSLNIKKGAKAGDNYLGVVYRAQATSDESDDSLSVIVKLPPQDLTRRDQFSVRPSFEREIKFYGEIYPIFYNFQLKKGIDVEKEGFYQIPKCFKTSVVEFEEGLFMSDLKVDGFEMFDRHQEISFEHCKIVVEILGKLHAISFAILDQEPELIEQFKSLEDIMVRAFDKPEFGDWFESIKERALGTLDSEKEAELIQRTREALNEPIADIVRRCVDGKNAEPFAVLCHGDCWNNNMMFKNDENGTVIDARLLDWQILRYGPPVCDLLYFFFTITTKELRDQHYNDLLKIYHESLSDFIRKLGSDPEKLYPFSSLQEQLRNYGKFGLVMSILLLPILTTKAEDCPDLEELSRQLERGETIEADCFSSADTAKAYEKKMGDIIRDLSQFGYF